MSTFRFIRLLVLFTLLSFISVTCSPYITTVTVPRSDFRTIDPHEGLYFTIDTHDGKSIDTDFFTVTDTGLLIEAIVDIRSDLSKSSKRVTPHEIKFEDIASVSCHYKEESNWSSIFKYSCD